MVHRPYHPKGQGFARWDSADSGSFQLRSGGMRSLNTDPQSDRTSAPRLKWLKQAVTGPGSGGLFLAEALAPAADGPALIRPEIVPFIEHRHALKASTLEGSSGAPTHRVRASAVGDHPAV